MSPCSALLLLLPRCASPLLRSDRRLHVYHRSSSSSRRTQRDREQREKGAGSPLSSLQAARRRGLPSSAQSRSTAPRRLSSSAAAQHWAVVDRRPRCHRARLSHQLYTAECLCPASLWSSESHRERDGTHPSKGGGNGDGDGDNVEKATHESHTERDSLSSERTLAGAFLPRQAAVAVDRN